MSLGSLLPPRRCNRHRRAEEFQHTSTLLRGLLLPARLKDARRQRPMSCWLFLSKSNSRHRVSGGPVLSRCWQLETTRVLSGHVQPLQATVKLYHLPHWSHLPWMGADHSRGMPGWFRMHRAWSVGSGASLPRGLLLRRRNAYARSLRSYEPPTASLSGWHVLSWRRCTQLHD